MVLVFALASALFFSFFFFKNVVVRVWGLNPKQTGSERLAFKKMREKRRQWLRMTASMVMWLVLTVLDARDCINALTFHSALFCQLVAARAFTASSARVAPLAFVPSLSAGGPQH